MKKTIELIIMLIMALIMLTGCVNVNYEVEIHEDGSGNISYIYGISKEKLGNSKDLVEQFVGTMKEQATESGYNVELYENNEISGFKADKYIEDLGKDFSLEEAFGKEYVTDTENNKINVQKDFMTTKYSQNTELDLTNLNDANVEMTYKIKLPVNVKTSNANSISSNGKELTWNLKSGEINTIEFTAEKVNVLPIAIIAIVAIVVIVIVVIVIFLILKQKHATKNKSNI